MAKGNSVRRNSAFDTSKPEFIRPQTRLEANRWLDKVTFGAATALTDIDASTKTNIVSIGNDEAVVLMGSTYAQYLEDAFVAEPTYSPTENITTPGTDLSQDYLYGNWEFGSPPTYGVAVQGTRDLNGFQRWLITEGIYGSARARIKATYALSQMIVCNTGVSGHVSITSFGGLLFDATKSTNTNSLKSLLKKVTYSRSMAYWLTYYANSKANPATGSRPDENYAREIMQLFSIGLDCLNLDGTPMLDANGDRIPTYTPEYIPEAAKFFTGLESYEGNVGYVDHLVPGPQWANHETAQKAALTYPDGTTHVLPEQVNFRKCIDAFANDAGYLITRIDADTFSVEADEFLPAGTGYSEGHFLGTSFGYSLTLNGPVIVAPGSARASSSTTITVIHPGHGLATGTRIWSKSNVEASIDYFLDVLTNHPTCAPFIAKSMIKHLVTNNPSPQYIRRVASKLLDNGSGVKGDLSAMFKAIFLDRECIVPYGKNQNNHGRYTTLFDRFMKLANNLRNDAVHYCHSTSAGPVLNGTRWGSPSHEVSLTDQSVNAIFTSPRCKVEYCAIPPDRAYVYPTPLASPSVFNFYRPGYVAPKTKLAELSLTSPELQITTAETQTLWANIALAATSYEDQNYNLGDFSPPNGTFSWESMDPRSGKGRMSGLNLSGRTTVTVTSLFAPVPEAFGDGFVGTTSLEHAIPAGPGGWLVQLYHRRLGAYGLYRCNRPDATGPASLTFVAMFTGFWDRTTQSGTNMLAPGNLQVGDVFDVAEFFVVGHSGFPGRFYGTEWQPFITLFHKAATYLPDTPTVNNAQLNVGIDYLESILMTEPISDELRQLMKNAANEPVVLPKRLLDNNDTPFLNHYRYMVYGYSQIRIRRMLAVLLVSPEFCTQY